MLRTLATILLVVSVGTVAFADVTIVQKVDVNEKDIDPKKDIKTEQVQTMMLKGKKVRVDFKDQKIYNLVDIEKGIWYTISPDKKTYSKISFDDLKEWRAAIFFQIEQSLSFLELLPPEMKALQEIDHAPKLKKCREELANKGKETKVEVKKLNEEKEIAGCKCRRVVIEEEGKVVIDLWITDKIDVKANLSEILANVAPFSKSVKKAIKNLKGFSLKTTYTFSIAGWTYTNSAEAKEIKTDDIAEKKFAIPEGYKEVPDTTPMFKPIWQYKRWKDSQKKKTGKKEEPERKPQEPKKETGKEDTRQQPPAPEQPEKKNEEKKGSG
jgi:hypothetical protein